MDNINFFNEKGNKIDAKLIFALTVPSIKKSFVAINNGDLVFNEESSYNNLDVFELTKEDGNNFYISDIKDEDWDLVKQAIIDEFFSKIK